MQNPLYDRRFEHDACGLGLIARADGVRSREMVERALAMLAAMEHRGARGADPETGDGAGPHAAGARRLLRRFARAELELELPPPGTTPSPCASCRTTRRCGCAARSCACASPSRRASSRSAGATCRATPRAIGRLARESEPVVRQLLVAQGPTGDASAFRRKLTVIRRRVELAAAARRVPEATFHIASFSSSTLTYKGLLTAPAAAGLLRRPARARDRDGDGARALALLDQHARLVGSRAPVPLPRAQRRDQHRARQHAVDARARAAAALGAARRRPAEAVPADRRALERLRGARRGASSCSCSPAARPRTRSRC